MVYGFLLNMWIMKRLDEQYLTQMVALKRITEEEKQMILATPQMVQSQNDYCVNLLVRRIKIGGV